MLFLFNPDIPNCIKSTNQGCKLLSLSLTFYMPKWNFQIQNKISTNPKNNNSGLKMWRILGFSISTWEIVTRKISAQQYTQAQIKKKKNAWPKPTEETNEKWSEPPKSQGSTTVPTLPIFTLWLKHTELCLSPLNWRLCKENTVKPTLKFSWGYFNYEITGKYVKQWQSRVKIYCTVHKINWR